MKWMEYKNSHEISFSVYSNKLTNTNKISAKKFILQRSVNIIVPAIPNIRDFVN